jgi:hypothetical protein
MQIKAEQKSQLISENLLKDKLLAKQRRSMIEDKLQKKEE